MIATFFMIIFIAVVDSLIKERAAMKAYKKSAMYIAFEPEKYLADKEKQKKPAPEVEGDGWY